MKSTLLNSLHCWVDSDAPPAPGDARRVDWARVTPFVLMHLGCLGVFWVGASASALALATALFALRM